MRAALVVNPRSAGGRTGRRLDALVAAARSAGITPVVFTTTGPGNGAAQAALASEADVDTVVAVGGDGTASEVVSGLLVDGRRPRVAGLRFAHLPAGTGCDLARALAIPRDPTTFFTDLVTAEALPLDVLRAELRGPTGPQVVTSVNVLGFGINGEVVRQVNAGSKRFGGTVTFALATLSALRAWTAPPVRVEWTGPAGPGRWEGRLLSAFVCNARACGGGLLPAPRAQLDDGAADLVLVPDTPVWRSVRDLPHLYRGTLDRVPHVVTASVHAVHAVAIDAHDVPVDVDGEQPGGLPVHVEVQRGCLRMLAPWPTRSGGRPPAFGSGR